MEKLLKQLEKRGYNASLSADGVEVYDIIEDDYIQIEVLSNGNAMLSMDSGEVQVDNNLNSILEELTYLANE